MWELRPWLGWRGQTAAGEEDIGGAVTRLAWPVVVENLLQTLLGVVDLIFVGALGAAALAGVGARGARAARCHGGALRNP